MFAIDDYVTAFIEMVHAAVRRGPLDEAEQRASQRQEIERLLARLRIDN